MWSPGPTTALTFQRERAREISVILGSQTVCGPSTLFDRRSAITILSGRPLKKRRGSSQCHAVEALVVAPMILVLDEASSSPGGNYFSGRMRFLRVWCQHSILPWVWGCSGTPDLAHDLRLDPFGEVLAGAIAAGHLRLVPPGAASQVWCASGGSDKGEPVFARAAGVPSPVHP